MVQSIKTQDQLCPGHTHTASGLFTNPHNQSSEFEHPKCCFEIHKTLTQYYVLGLCVCRLHSQCVALNPEVQPLPGHNINWIPKWPQQQQQQHKQLETGLQQQHQEQQRSYFSPLCLPPSAAGATAIAGDGGGPSPNGGSTAHVQMSSLPALASVILQCGALPSGGTVATAGGGLGVVAATAVAGGQQQQEQWQQWQQLQLVVLCCCLQRLQLLHEVQLRLQYTCPLTSLTAARKAAKRAAVAAGEGATTKAAATATVGVESKPGFFVKSLSEVEQGEEEELDDGGQEEGEEGGDGEVEEGKEVDEGGVDEGALSERAAAAAAVPAAGQAETLKQQRQQQQELQRQQLLVEAQEEARELTRLLLLPFTSNSCLYRHQQQQLPQVVWGLGSLLPMLGFTAAVWCPYAEPQDLQLFVQFLIRMRILSVASAFEPAAAPTAAVAATASSPISSSSYSRYSSSRATCIAAAAATAAADGGADVSQRLLRGMQQQQEFRSCWAGGLATEVAVLLENLLRTSKRLVGEDGMAGRVLRGILKPVQAAVGVLGEVQQQEGRQLQEEDERTGHMEVCAVAVAASADLSVVVGKVLHPVLAAAAGEAADGRGGVGEGEGSGRMLARVLRELLVGGGLDARVGSVGTSGCGSGEELQEQQQEEEQEGEGVQEQHRKRKKRKKEQQADHHHHHHQQQQQEQQLRVWEALEGDVLQLLSVLELCQQLQLQLWPTEQLQPGLVVLLAVAGAVASLLQGLAATATATATAAAGGVPGGEGLGGSVPVPPAVQPVAEAVPAAAEPARAVALAAGHVLSLLSRCLSSSMLLLDHIGVVPAGATAGDPAVDHSNSMLTEMLTGSLTSWMLLSGQLCQAVASVGAVAPYEAAVAGEAGAVVAMRMVQSICYSPALALSSATATAVASALGGLEQGSSISGSGSSSDVDFAIAVFDCQLAGWLLQGVLPGFSETGGRTLLLQQEEQQQQQQVGTKRKKKWKDKGLQGVQLGATAMAPAAATAASEAPVEVNDGACSLLRAVAPLAVSLLQPGDSPLKQLLPPGAKQIFGDQQQRQQAPQQQQKEQQQQDHHQQQHEAPVGVLATNGGSRSAATATNDATAGMALAVAGGAVCAGLGKMLDKAVAAAGTAAVARVAAGTAVAAADGNGEDGSGKKAVAADAGATAMAATAKDGTGAGAGLPEGLLQQLPGLMGLVGQVLLGMGFSSVCSAYTIGEQQQQQQEEQQQHAVPLLNHRAVFGYICFLRSASIALVKSQFDLPFDQLVDQFLVLLQVLLPPSATPQLPLLHLQMGDLEVQLNEALKPRPIVSARLLRTAATSSNSSRVAAATAADDAAATAVLRKAVLLGLRDLMAVAQRSHLLQLHKGLRERLQAGGDPVGLQALHQVRRVTEGWGHHRSF